MRPESITDKLAVYAALGLTLFMIVFQFLLAIGLPLGHAAWGGKYEVLPTNFRVGSAVNVIIYFWIGACVLRASGLALKSINFKIARVTLYIFGSFLVLGVLMNLASPSHWERYLMAPTALAFCLSTLHIAYHSGKLTKAKKA